MNKIALMEDDKTVKLSIPRGYYVFAEMSTMSDFNVKMMLRDAQSQKVSLKVNVKAKMLYRRSVVFTNVIMTRPNYTFILKKGSI